MEAKKLLEEFDKLPNDVERWKWVQSHQDTGILIHLDNDDTSGTLPDPDDPEDVLVFQFENFVGWDQGIDDLLKAVGIKAECV